MIDNYEEKIRKEIESQGGDSSLFDTFLAIEKLDYINKESIETFSVWDFILKLKENEDVKKSVFLYSDFCNQNLSYKGCLTLEKGIEDDSKMAVFSRLKMYLSNTFPEFEFLGDIRAIPADFTKVELENEIEKKSNRLKTYIYTLIESMNLELEEYQDKVVNAIHAHVEDLLSFDELTSPELARFSLSNANPEVIKKQITIAVERILTSGTI